MILRTLVWLSCRPDNGRESAPPFLNHHTCHNKGCWTYPSQKDDNSKQVKMSVSLLMFRLLSDKKYRVNFGFIEIQFFACLAESTKRQYVLNVLASRSAMHFWRVEKETGTQGSIG